MSEQVTVEIEESSNETVKTTALTETAARDSGLSVDEIEAGKKHGLITDDNKPAKKPAKVNDDETEEEDFSDDDEDKGDNEDEDSADAEKVEETPDPQDAAEEDIDPEKEAELIKGYNINEKTLYWKAKKERLKRQSAQRESEHTKIKLAAAQREIDALKKGTKKDDEEEAGQEEGEDDNERVMTVGEFKKMLADQKKEQGKANAQAQETIVRLEQQEAEFKTEHSDFDEVMDLAKEMMNKSPSFRNMLLAAGADPNVNAAEVAYNIGRLNPKYKKGGTKPKTEVEEGSKTKVEKAIKNADKRQSSAAVASGGTKRIVSETDLTVEDAAKLSPAAYEKLSPKTRERLLRESC